VIRALRLLRLLLRVTALRLLLRLLRRALRLLRRVRALWLLLCLLRRVRALSLLLHLLRRIRALSLQLRLLRRVSNGRREPPQFRRLAVQEVVGRNLNLVQASRLLQSYHMIGMTRSSRRSVLPKCGPIFNGNIQKRRKK
jgi:hypothetical protein